MKRVVLVTFNPDEALARLDALRRAGLEAEHVGVRDFKSLAGIRSNPPDAIVIDLGRLPSHGKEVAVAVRQYSATRTVPIVFIEGDPAKTGKVRGAVPDAVFTTWASAGKILHAVGPVSPAPRVATAYSATPLPQKLGIKAGSKVMAIAPPDEFEEVLGRLPEDVEFVKSGAPDVLIVFTRSQAELEVCFPRAIARAGDKTRLWIAWPKKTSGMQSDLNGDSVRKFGLAMGWVDYKVCAIDSTWSGYAFAPKKETGARRLRQAAPREEVAAKKSTSS